MIFKYFKYLLLLGSLNCFAQDSLWKAKASDDAMILGQIKAGGQNPAETIEQKKKTTKTNNIGFAVETNVLFPVRYINDNWYPGLDLAFDFKLNSKWVLRSSFHINRELNSTTTIGGVLIGADYVLKNYLEKVGLRLMFKRYSGYNNAEIENTLQEGFFWGVFSDLMVAQTHYVRTKNGVIYQDTIPAKGLFIGAGLCLGYTLKINQWIIEPNLGFGVATATGGILLPPNPNAFPYDTSGLDNLGVILSPTHLELHVGREF